MFCHPLKLYMLLYNAGTVFFYCYIVSLGLSSKVKAPYFHTYEREREREIKYTVNVSVVYSTLYYYFI